MGVAKESRAGISISRFHQVRIRIAVVAGGPDLLLAEQTVSAGYGEGHHDPITSAQIGHILANLFDDTHELMPENVPGFHSRNEPIIKMQI